MSTLIPQPVTYFYRETDKGRYKTVKRYELTQTDTAEPKLSGRIKISKDQKFAKSSPCYWLELHDGKKFIKPRLTGLFKTSRHYVYYGDVGVNGRKENTLLFKFSKNGEDLTILYFENYFPHITEHLINCIL